ncbi:MAG: HupE/UreJ family protein [Gammaproteobacteria bacterium]|nr:HupE/UreJ family protein [Gammaproteobacteria bacterium]
MSRFWLLCALLLCGPALAHRAGDSLLRLTAQGEELRGEWLVSVRDLELAYGLDGDQDGRITWGELRAADGSLRERLVRELLLVADGQACALSLDGLALQDRDDGPAARYLVAARCPAHARRLAVDYRFLGTLDRGHRGLLSLRAGTQTLSASLGAGQSRAELDLDGGEGAGLWMSYVAEGLRHIAIGADHILFLVALLFGVAGDSGRRVRPALWQAAGVVTAFTLAHSLTLGLAVFGILDLPSRLVESLIAASVAFAALNNLWSWVRRLWAMSFGFGLVHGLGFAGVLAELGLPPGAKALALFGFNLGVELGQLALVLGVLPLLILLRRTTEAARPLLAAGSLAIAGLGLIWLAERAGEVEILGWL